MKTIKNEILKITNAQHLGGYKIFISFSDNKQRIINFDAIFFKYLKGDYKKFLQPAFFKKFTLESGNIYWGKNEEVIFPVSFLYKSRHGISQKEEALYVL